MRYSLDISYNLNKQFNELTNIMTENIDKKELYKALCEYQKTQFEDEKSQYFKLEDKSSKYLTFLNIFIPLYIFCFTYFLKDLPESTNSFLKYLLISTVVLSLIAFCSAWSLIFRSLKLMSVPKMPSDQNLMNLYYKNTLSDLYLYTADRYRQAIDVYKSVNNEKIKLINRTYSDIAFGSWIFVISILMLLIIKVIES